MQTTTTLADLLDAAATDVDLRNFAALRRSLRQRCAREGVDHAPIWTANIPDFRAGCAELAASLRSAA